MPRSECCAHCAEIPRLREEIAALRARLNALTTLPLSASDPLPLQAETHIAADSPARPFPSSPVTVSMTVASGQAQVQALLPGPVARLGRGNARSGSWPSPAGSKSGSGRLRHAPFGKRDLNHPARNHCGMLMQYKTVFSFLFLHRPRRPADRARPMPFPLLGPGGRRVRIPGRTYGPDGTTAASRRRR
jgi:hypothetical protein